MAKTLISTHTASSDSSIDITSGIDSTYPVYEFHFVNIHPGTDNKIFQFQVNATDGADFNDSPITSNTFRAYHDEADSSAALAYRTAMDEANAANYQDLSEWGSTEDDASISGVLTIYDPSSTTYVKHFIAEVNDNYDGTSIANYHVSGYINDTTAIDEISFKFDSGNIDAGVIKMFGVS